MPEAEGSNRIAAAIVLGALLIAGAFLVTSMPRADPTPFQECVRVHEVEFELPRYEAVLACHTHS